MEPRVGLDAFESTDVLCEPCVVPRVEERRDTCSVSPSLPGQV